MKFFRFLEQFERRLPKIFWSIVFVIAFSFNLPIHNNDLTTNPPVVELVTGKQTTLFIDRGGGKSDKFSEEQFAANTGVRDLGGGTRNGKPPVKTNENKAQTKNNNPGKKKTKKFNLLFHIALRKEFPNWPDRTDYQKKQEQFYRSAMKKQEACRNLRIRNPTEFYTKQELDSIDYFHGTGFYARQQSIDVKPNIYDTRESFLHKMHCRDSREKFLKSYKHLKENKSNSIVYERQNLKITEN